MDIYMNIYILAKYPPSAGFPSPSGGVAPWVPPLGAFGATVGAPTALIWETAAFSGGERKKEKKIGAPWGAIGADDLMGRQLSSRRLRRR